MPRTVAPAVDSYRPVYDAIIAATAKEHRATLLSLDRRAQRTYEAIGARYELIG